MADSLKFSLVSPERQLASVEAKSVQIPGTDGIFTAMPGHAPFLSTLRPGVVRVTAVEGGETDFFVTGGFAEVSAEAASVLAEEAVERSMLERDWLASKLSEAEAALEVAPEHGKIAASQRVYDFRAALDQLG